MTLSLQDQGRGGASAELSAAIGYLMNAKIDLETGCPKATAIRTLEGGIKRLRDFIDEAQPDVTSELVAALAGFVNDLTGALQNRTTMLTINHDALRRRIEQAQAVLAKVEAR